MLPLRDKGQDVLTGKTAEIRGRIRDLIFRARSLPLATSLATLRFLERRRLAGRTGMPDILSVKFPEAECFRGNLLSRHAYYSQDLHLERLKQHACLESTVLLNAPESQATLFKLSKKQ